jgi:hypothetical protein
MSGMLFHGKSFKNEAYKGADGKLHTELRVVDGDFIGVSNTTWSMLMRLCEAQGLSKTCWPVYKDSIDVPLDDVYEKNNELKVKFLNLAENFMQTSEWLQKISKFLSSGEMIAYVTM